MKLYARIPWSGFASLALCVSSCNPGLYSTVGQNVPLFTEKGEVALSGGKSNSTNEYEVIKGFHAQLAIALDSNLAVISSLYSLKSMDDETVNRWAGKGSYFEVGIGKFKTNKSRKITCEIFIGAGLGSLKNTFESEYVNARYLKPFIQPTVGFTSKYFDVALTSRIALVSYLSHTQQLDTDENYQISNFFSTKEKTLVFEPGLTIRAGFEHVKLQIQSNYSTFRYEAVDFEPIYNHYSSIGIFFLVTERWSKKHRL